MPPIGRRCVNVRRLDVLAQTGEERGEADLRAEPAAAGAERTRPGNMGERFGAERQYKKSWLSLQTL